jgi:hypothetical protein
MNAKHVKWGLLGGEPVGEERGMIGKYDLSNLGTCTKIG